MGGTEHGHLDNLALGDHLARAYEGQGQGEREGVSWKNYREQHGGFGE